MRRVQVLVMLAALACAGYAHAQDRPRVGVLKLTSSAPIFVGVEKGFFKEFGVAPELVYFQAAAPISTAVAAGQIDVGATGLTAATYNIVLGGEKMWIVADKGREWPDHRLTAIVVRKDLYEAGVRRVGDLKGKRIGITQLGSTFHYQIGNILEKDGMSLKDVSIVPLQAMAAALEALRGKQIDAVILPQPFPGRAEADGFGRIIAWGGDLFPWQIATVFYSRKFAADRVRAVNFMKGYVKSSRHYYDAVLSGGQGAAYDEVVAVTARYTAAPEAVIKLGLPYQDRSGRLWVEDIARQMTWWQRHGFIKATIRPTASAPRTRRSPRRARRRDSRSSDPRRRRCARWAAIRPPARSRASSACPWCPAPSRWSRATPRPRGSRARSATPSCSRPRWAAAARACASCGVTPSWSRPCARRGPRPVPPSATRPSTSSAPSPSRGTSRSRSSPTRTATSSTSASASARSSGATRS